MSFKRSIGFLGFLLLTILLGITTASATGDAPVTPVSPVQPFDGNSLVVSTEIQSQSSVSIPGLKAVLIVGPIDGDFGDWTQQEKQNMNLAADTLISNGVEVHKFYAPNNSWDEIKAAADGAHFLFYRGHGVSWGTGTPLTVGGLALSSQVISPDQIRSDLHLAENAIVMLYGCYTAGTSSSDYPNSISIEEAKRRVEQYADPFLDVGAGGYYANWFGSAFEKFVEYLFTGMSLGEAYESYFDYNSQTVERYVHPEDTALNMWLDSDYWSDMTQYNNAFVGKSTATLQELFTPLEMEVNPPVISIWAQPDNEDYSMRVQVESTGEAFSWEAMENIASWLILTNDHGQSGDELSFDVMVPESIGTYETEIIVYTEDVGVANNYQTIIVSLEIRETVYSLFIPSIGE